MYNYSITSGNPEGFDFVIDVQHEKKFEREEFRDICEEAFVSAMEKEMKEEGHVCKSSISTEYIIAHLLKKGFKTVDRTAAYDFEPYWSGRSVKNERLRKLCEITDPFEEY